MTECRDVTSLVSNFVLRVLLFLHCSYDKLNKNALRDAELYDRTGRVRTPSPVTLSDSEEDNAAPSKGKEDNSKHAGDTEFSKPHVVACVGDEVGAGCSSPKNPVSNDADSATSGDADTDCDFHPSEPKYDTDSATTSTSAEDDTTVEEESLATSEDEGLLDSKSSKVHRNTQRKSTSKTEKNLPSNSEHVSSSFWF